MASSFVNHLSLSLLLITILSSHAQLFFNKISAAAVVPINLDKYSSNHPYQIMTNINGNGNGENAYRGVRNGYRNNYYGNGENGYDTFNGGRNAAYSDNGRNNYYGSGVNGYEFNGGRNSVAVYENQNRNYQGINNENYRP